MYVQKFDDLLLQWPVCFGLTVAQWSLEADNSRAQEVVLLNKSFEVTGCFYYH